MKKQGMSKDHLDIDLASSGEDWRAVLSALIAEREGTLGIRASLEAIARAELE